MATGSPFMGTMKGKLGETVAARRNGKQVFRTYVANPKNPNSQKQQVQRMVQNTACQAYSAMKRIVDHSFEGVQVGAKSMAYFESKNMKYLRDSITAGTDGSLVSASANFNKKGENSIVLNEYIMAKGTLPEINIPDDTRLMFDSINKRTSLVLYSNGLGDLESAFNQLSLDFSLSEGDWVTFCFILRERTENGFADGKTRFAFARFIAERHRGNPDSYLELNLQLTSDGGSAGPGEDFFILGPEVEDSHQGLYLVLDGLLNNIGDGENQYVVAGYTIIHSRQDMGGSWLRSNAKFRVRDYLDNVDFGYPENLFPALATYSGEGQTKGNGDYILNGGDN